jgi:hypothetical protein
MNVEHYDGGAREPPQTPREPLSGALDRIRAATDGIEPPPDFAARVLAQTARARAPTWVVHLGPVGRRFVPFAAMAAAAALALAWSAQSGLDETAPSALDLAQSDLAQSLP